MEKIGLRHWLQISADVGLLVGLVFVGFQLYQDREMKTAELIASSLQEHHARNISLMGGDPASTLSKLDSDQALDARDQFIAQAYFDARFANWSRNSILENLGMLPASWRNGIVLPDHLWANPYGIEAVESYLEGSPFLTTGLISQLSAELERVKTVRSKQTPTPAAD